MSTLIANAGSTQNLTGAATFAAAEAGALAAVLNRNTTTAIAAATTVTSVTFTVTNLDVIDAVLLWVKVTAASPTGTFKVDLQKGGVSQASVTVNKTDLPDSTNAVPVPVLFKLTSNATGDGGANWTIVITTTLTGTVTVNIASATTTNYTRALRTTTAATAAAGDDLYIIGELTGAGTHTSRTITMNQTATTAYGNASVNSTTVSGGLISVSCYGTLTYGNTSTINYVLRVAGDLIVSQFGTLNIGSSGAEIPRDGTAVLEFLIVSTEGDFGLIIRDNATVNIAGLSRTVGKNVAQTKLTADTTSNLITGFPGTSTNVTAAVSTTTLDPTSTSVQAGVVLTLADTVTNAAHAVSSNAVGSVTNVSQVFSIWLARGSGTNNRFARIALGSTTGATSPPTNGFYADVDLQLGTIGACTANGNGTATSSSIVAVGAGYLCTIIGKASSGALSPIAALNICSASGVTSFAGAANQSLIYYSPAVYTLSARPTDLTVNDDTGWLTGDVIAIASTSRTPTESELGVLASNAGASTLALSIYPIAAGTYHSGTSPTQAEVVLLTRNVKIRSTSNTLHSYVSVAGTAVFTCSWAEFSYMGATTSGKRGLEIAGVASGTAGAKSVTYCSFHDAHFGGTYFAISGLNSLNTTYSNNVHWLTAISGSQSCTMDGALTLTDWTLDSNTIVRGSASNGVFQTLDQGGTFTNNTVAGGVGIGWLINEGAVAFGTFSGNTVHSCSGVGMNCGAITGTISNTKCWRNGGVGMQLNIGTDMGLTIDTIEMFGNLTANLNFASSSTQDCRVISATSTGDSTFATTTAFSFSAFTDVVTFENCDTTASGIKVGCTNDFALTIGSHKEITNRNCKFGGTNLIASKVNWSKESFCSFEKYGQTAGDHRMEVREGIHKTDTTIFNAASPSQRMTPNSATLKLESAIKHRGMLVAVANGGTVSISVYARKSAVGDGTAYNGNQPRLIQRANPALGANSDVVLATMTVATGNWELLTATSSTATDDGAWEFIVDCDGTTGWINVDDWAAA